MNKKISKITLIGIVAATVVFSLFFVNFNENLTPNGGRVLGATTWYSFDWGYRTAITIDHTKVLKTDQTDFPVLINSIAANWRDTGNGGHVGQTNGNDFVFTLDDNTTKLSHEIEKYDNTTGQFVAWVKIPSLSTSADTVINLYYGNAACVNQSAKTSVWTNNYAGVYHFSEATWSGDNAMDSTINNKNLTPSAGAETAVGGMAYRMGTFPGGTYLIRGDFLYSVTSQFSVSAWFKTSNIAEAGFLLNSGLSTSGGYGFYFSNTDQRIYAHVGNATVSSSGNTFKDGNWHQAVLVNKNVAGSYQFALFVDGQRQTDWTAVGAGGGTNLVVGASNWTWGGNFTGSTDANIDELNIVPATRSDGWIATEYNNRHDPSTFYGLSSATPADASAPINPASYSGYSDSAKATTLTTSQWYSYASPYFEWSAATDPETDIEGYWVYFGTDPSATPSVSGSFQVATNYTASSMTSGNTYYLRLQSQNVADVVSTAETFFTYKYDSTSPSAPDYVNISPVGCSINTSFTFTWPAGVDTGGSDIAGYDYRRGSTGTIQQTTELTATTTSYQEGENIFYVRSRDNAGNTSAWQTAVYCSTATAQIADGPTITAGPSSILVNWNSSKATTGYVKVYDGNTYISEQGHTEYTLTHSVRVVGLEPEKAYRYQLIWSDSSGNLGSADWYSTTTATAPAVKNLEVTIISPTSASVTWSTTQEASSALEYGVGSYSNSEDLSGYGTTFSKTFSGLTSGNIYQIRIKGTTTGDSTKFFAAKDFTMPPLPEISSLSYEMIDSGSTVGAKVSWKTNTDTTTSLFYGQKGSNFKEVATTDKVRDHSAEVSGLSDSSVYDFYVAGADAYGNTAKSSTLSFSTPADRRPPTISEIITETSNVGLNKQDKAQIVISWKTDEQSTSYVEYDTGLSGSEYKQKSAEDKNLTNSHIVILSDLTPSQPYHLRVSSADKGNNIAKSEDITIIAGDVPKSIFNIITNTFENVFGWLGKLI